jgi:hypothetical protein
MKLVILISISLFLLNICNGQIKNSHENGGYKTIQEFIENKPSIKDTLTIIRRTTSDIFMWGGNDFKVESNVQTLTSSVLKNSIWGIYQNDTLYLNGKILTGLPWFAKCEIFGKYCFLRPSYPIAPKDKKELGLNHLDDLDLGYMFGPIGGALEGGQMATERIPIIYELETGKKMLLTEHNLKIILENYPTLKTEFETESNIHTAEKLLKYLKKINEL